jgi:hypothetical protein
VCEGGFTRGKIKKRITDPEADVPIGYRRYQTKKGRREIGENRRPLSLQCGSRQDGEPGGGQ